MIDVLWLDGTGSPSGGTGVSETFRHALDPAKFTFTYVNYPAQYGDPMPYNESRRQGAVAQAAAVERSPNPAIIGGYSQGAAATIELAQQLDQGKYPHLEVLAVANIADPHELPHGPRGHLSGIAGARTTQLRRFSAIAPGDVICDLPEGNPLRGLADMSEFMGIQSSHDRQQWAIDVMTKLAERRLQRWWEFWQDWDGAGAYARGYLLDGRHDRDYVEDGHCEILARQLNWMF